MTTFEKYTLVEKRRLALDDQMARGETIPADEWREVNLIYGEARVELESDPAAYAEWLMSIKKK